MLKESNAKAKISKTMRKILIRMRIGLIARKDVSYYGEPKHRMECWKGIVDLEKEVAALKGGCSKGASSSGALITRTFPNEEITYSCPLSC